MCLFKLKHLSAGGYTSHTLLLHSEPLEKLSRSIEYTKFGSSCSSRGMYLEWVSNTFPKHNYHVFEGFQSVLLFQSIFVFCSVSETFMLHKKWYTFGVNLNAFKHVLFMTVVILYFVTLSVLFTLIRASLTVV